MKIFYRRNLPHLQPKNGVFALTICLAGSLPKHKVLALKDERELFISTARKSGKSEQEIKQAIQKAHELYFGKYDDLLDNPKNSPTWLSNPKIANIIRESLHHLDGQDYKLVAYCIMSNHLHLIIYKCQKPLFKIMESFKKYTGLRANDVIYGEHKKGDKRPAFWKDESYDHLVRDRNDFYSQVQYVLNNPVKLGLVKDWRDWEFSFVRGEFLKYAP